SSATGPNQVTNTSPFTIGYSASDAAPSSGLDKVELWVKLPAGSSYSLAATDSTPAASGHSFSYTAAGEGTYSFYTRAYDKAGNAETAPVSPDYQVTVLYDTTAPTTAIAFSPAAPDGSNGWYSWAPSFTLSASAAPSGVYASYYPLDGGATQAYSGAVAIPDGQHTVSYWSFDNAGNEEAHHTTATIKVDTVKPVSSATGPNQVTNTSPFTIGYSASDAAPSSGLDKVELWVKLPAGSSYSLAATDSTPAASGHSFSYTAAGEGTYSFYTRAYDKAGNAETAPVSPDYQVTVLYDTTAPTTAIAFSPAAPDGSNGWYSWAPSFTLSASAAPSGVYASYYPLDGGATQAYSGAVAIPDGQHTVSYWSFDNAGNEEAHHTTATIKVDTVKPVSSATGPNQVTNTSPFTIGYSASDAAPSSGLDKVELWVKLPAGSSYSLAATDSTPAASGHSFSYTAAGEGTYSFYTRAYDKAGNAETAPVSPDYQVTVLYDTTAPTTAIAFSPAAPDGSNGWYSWAPSFTLSASAAPSGVYASYYPLDGGATQAYSGAVAIPDGQHTVSYWSFDNAGNEEAHHTTATIKVDTVKPVSSATGPNQVTNTSPFTIGYSASDAAPSSGLDKVELWVKLPAGSSYSLAATDSTPAASGHSFSYTAAGEGTYSFYTRAYDKAGNAETAPVSPDYQVTVLYDTTAPTTANAFSPAAPDGSNGWYSPTPSFTLSASDGGSDPPGVNKTYYPFHGRPTQPYSGAVAIPDGQHTVSYWSFDNAGNEEAHHTTATIKVDTVKPVSSATGPNQVTNTSPFTIGYSASDAAPSSGLDKVELWVKLPAGSSYSLAATDSTPAASGHSFSYTAAGEGTYSFYTRAYDKAGNAETA